MPLLHLAEPASHPLDGTSSERWRRIEMLYDAALQRDPAERGPFLEDRCGADDGLRHEVETLLRHGAVSRAFFDAPAAELPLFGAAGAIGNASLPHNASVDEGRFPDTGRFRMVKRLGAGGMGVVYEAHDTVRGEVVALKTLRRSAAADLLRLKREFRSLVDVAHPNLVCLYELFVDDDRGFFTMEKVDGVSFVDYAHRGDRPFGFHLLLAAFRQLVDGVSALHARGKIHRDIKPSNVLVTPDGRVVILDFSLTTERRQRHAAESICASGGTPAYMPPESVSGDSSEAGDWYSVGVTLYEALTRTLPFTGPVQDVLLRKRTADPQSPAEIAPDVPADLSAICMGLLHRNPAERLSGPEALRRLGAQFAPIETTPALGHEAPFVGRDRQLQVLHDALGALATGRAAAVTIHGPSGIGKSALVRCFLSEAREEPGVVVLSGRCYESESVPYKALDGVIDDLSRHLTAMPREDVEPLVPADAPALTRVFPVLLQVGAIAALTREQRAEREDVAGLRRRAFHALRELFARLADRQRLVMFIDDLQWVDADSVVLLEELLRATGTPAILTILCFRSEETAAKPFLQALLDRAGREPWLAIRLDPMTEDEAYTLIGRLIPAETAFTDEDRRQMTREAAGSPFVLEQLASYAAGDRDRAPTFSEMFQARVDALPPAARRFLEILAICGRPMAPDLLCDVSGIERDRQSLVARLRASRLIRSSGSSHHIEAYHDRIREGLTVRVDAEAARSIHALMVHTLVERESDDCEALFEHYRGAGDAENASLQAALAGEKAATALAFGRAASFYRQALTLCPTPPTAPAWEEALAVALANAGRPVEAADAYLRAASRARHPRRVELQRRAAEQSLISGDIDRGLDLMRTVLAGIGVSVPRSPCVALLQLLWRRARLRWRGLRYVATPANRIDTDTLLRIDTCWALTTGLMAVDMISASNFSVLHLLMALDAGEPYRIARAMAMESAARGAYPTDTAWSTRLDRESKALAARVANPHANALTILADAIVATTRGQWTRASILAEQASGVLRERCVGATWESNMAANLVIWSQMYRGELGPLSERLPGVLADARSRGNMYIATELCTRSNFIWLAADQPDEGEREARESIARWSHKGFHRQHYSARLARVQTALYRGDAEAAWRLHAEQEAVLRRSLLTQVQVIRVEARYLRARVALAMAARDGAPRQFLAIARAETRRIARERMPWSDPIALLVSAAVAFLEGDAPQALERLHDAVNRFDRADMNLYAAVTRLRIGALQDDVRGCELRRQANEWMVAQQIKNPVAMTRMLAPGFPDR
jgi:eukaryotic-like serine/threonine-protein kinase